jgi:hypothetical protein
MNHGQKLEQMKTNTIAETKHSQMQPLEVEPPNKLIEEEVKSIESKVGART